MLSYAGTVCVLTQEGQFVAQGNYVVISELCLSHFVKTKQNKTKPCSELLCIYLGIYVTQKPHNGKGHARVYAFTYVTSVYLVAM